MYRKLSFNQVVYNIFYKYNLLNYIFSINCLSFVIIEDILSFSYASPDTDINIILF